ncbi:hypothetical protein GPECTOR_13g619 [Gonium pectorale]|uniref:Uncharacterized protein n=1 Tax=Gonium pectorale TaxID=33097 RepID=A0A150GN26_GONPE|nr:hypothetical protein GPECTOR_13g619 [Gonium pectorale]|eukprot:KXZ51132.1 hypothetical protein GPECTOR_13g619 [Gonium pectorale]
MEASPSQYLALELSHLSSDNQKYLDHYPILKKLLQPTRKDALPSLYFKPYKVHLANAKWDKKLKVIKEILTKATNQLPVGKASKKVARFRDQDDGSHECGSKAFFQKERAMDKKDDQKRDLRLLLGKKDDVVDDMEWWYNIIQYFC